MIDTNYGQRQGDRAGGGEREIESPLGISKYFYLSNSFPMKRSTSACTFLMPQEIGSRRNRKRPARELISAKSRTARSISYLVTSALRLRRDDAIRRPQFLITLRCSCAIDRCDVIDARPWNDCEGAIYNNSWDWSLSLSPPPPPLSLSLDLVSRIRNKKSIKPECNRSSSRNTQTTCLKIISCIDLFIIDVVV